MNSLAVGVLLTIASVTPQDAIREVFGPNSVMEQVAVCESGMRQFDANGEVIVGKVTPDRGLYQIAPKYHLVNASKMGLDLDTLQGNILYAKYLYDRNGIKDWSASRACLDRHFIKRTLV